MEQMRRSDSVIKRDALTNFRTEFSELIKVSKVPLVMLHRPFQSVQRMSLALTGHHLVLVSKMEDAEREKATRRGSTLGLGFGDESLGPPGISPNSSLPREELWILHRNIDSIERHAHGSSGSSSRRGSASLALVKGGANGHSSNASNSSGSSSTCDSPMGGSIFIKTKDLRILRVDLLSSEEFLNVAEALEKLGAIDDITRSYPFFYNPGFRALEDGWNSFTLEEEFSQLLHAPDTDWRITTVNKDFSVCRSYPRTVIVPMNVNDDQIRASAAFRQGGRFPVLSYRHYNGNVIVRTSQPLSGQQQRRCRDDERILAAIIQKQRKGYIIDTRTSAASHSERAKGGGYELEQYYPRWKRLNKSIDRYYYFLDSYSKLMEACSDLASSSDKWLSRLTVSSWLTHVKEILNCGCLIAQCVAKENASVLVHGSEGVDITLCVTAIAQVVLNPDCRTFRGFEALIEREWIQAGHPFWSRTTKGPFNDSVAAKSKNHAPTFIIFLDCVWQIYNQFPCSFEFTEDFLILLSNHAYTSNFGTFLADCECEREQLCVKDHTVSLWAYLNRPEVLELYLNYMYEPNKRIIWPSVAPISLRLWSAMYMRWLIDPRPTEDLRAAQRAIVIRHKEARMNVLKLRRKLEELLEEGIAAGVFSDTPEDIASPVSDTTLLYEMLQQDLSLEDDVFPSVSCGEEEDDNPLQVQEEVN